ncbi:MAG: type II toxin-antitoxin system VapC family toxin [Chloroflexi bacterium]|nr:type II toxin-antitoxin system VapC family toxin [Chloroflexota bacterium]
MILLDTTVLAYAVGEEHPLREPCRRLLAAHAEGRLEATTTIEAIQEFTHIRARRRSRSDAVRIARHYVAALSPLMTTSDDQERGLQLFERHPELGAFDAVLAAVALGRGAEALVSADQAFASVPGLAWIDPATPAIARLIG